MEHFRQLKKPGHELLQNPGCLSGEKMTQTKKRKAIEKVRGCESSNQAFREAVKSVLLSVMFSNTLFKKIVVRDWSKSIGGGGGGGWAGAFGNVVDKIHMTHPLPSAQK